MKQILDIVLVAALLYGVFQLLKGTRALQMVVGLILLLALQGVARWAELYTVDWLVTAFWSQIVLVLVILFQPEIRKALAQIGQGLFTRGLTAMEETRTIDEIIKAAVGLVNRRLGGIFVLERENELKDSIEMGTPLDAVVTKELLISVFLPHSPIHDGAAIIKGSRLLAAGCFLPLTLNPDISKVLGTRHRAALGVTEETDAVVIVISEETGAISVVMGGKMTRELDSTGLRRVLTRIFLREGRRERGFSRLRRLLPGAGGTSG